MLVWWITEAVPIPVTALLGAALAVVCGVGGATEIFAAFGDPIVLLFLGGFVLASALVSSGLDRRIAFAILARPAVAASPGRILLGFALRIAAASAWMHNTSTTAMFFPIALSVLSGAASDSIRRTSTERGYQSAAWRAFRTYWLSRHPLCGSRLTGPSPELSVCVQRGFFTHAKYQQVDHIRPVTGPEIRAFYR